MLPAEAAAGGLLGTAAAARDPPVGVAAPTTAGLPAPPPAAELAGSTGAPGRLGPGWELSPEHDAIASNATHSSFWCI